MRSAVLTAFIIATKTDFLTPHIALVEQGEASSPNGSLRGRPYRGWRSAFRPWRNTAERETW
jgi:hypothetical protein